MNKLRNKLQSRCLWCGSDPLYIRYHDEEWGVPVHDDLKLFEFIVLESAQAGLSWITILRKRENYRKAFSGFDPKKVARFSEAKVEKLMLDSGIVRNRAKIKATISNAKCFLTIQKEFGSFAEYMWSFVKHRPIVNRPKTMSQVPATSELSDRLSQDLKKRGFKFMGSTIVYAHLQAVGMVDDHLTSCFRKGKLKTNSKAKKRA